MTFRNMNRPKLTNSVFPHLDDEVKLEPFVWSSTKISYDRKVKISDWQDRYLMEPRDNTEFFPPKGNLRMATYKKLGTYTPPIYLSETREKIRRYKPSDFDKCSEPVTLLNMFSFPLTCNDIKKETELKTERKFTSVNVREIKPEELPDTSFRRTLGYSLEDLERIEGMRTFLDDDLEIHKQISDLRKKPYNR